MAIIFNCKCGKQMRAPDKFAGRRLACKACGKVVQIPGGPEKAPPKNSTPTTPPAMPEAAPPDRPSPPAMPAPTAEDAATPDDATAAMFQDAPAPGAAEPSPEDDDQTVSMAAPVEDDEDDEDDDEYEEEDESPLARPVVANARTSRDSIVGQMMTPWADGREQQPDLRKGGRGFLVLLVLLLIGGVAGAAVYYWDELSPYDKTERTSLTDLDLVPSDAIAFSTIRPRDLLQHVDVDKAQSYKAMLNAWLNAMLEAPAKSSPLIDSSKVDRITLVKLDPIRVDGKARRDFADWWMLISIPGYDKAALASRLQQFTVSASASGQSYILNRGGPSPGQVGVFFVNDSVICIASQNGMEDFLSRRLARRKSRPLNDALQLAESKTAVAAVTMRQPWNWPKLRTVARLWLDYRFTDARSIETIQSATIVVDLAEKANVEATLEFASREATEFRRYLNSNYKFAARQFLGQLSLVSIARNPSLEVEWRQFFGDYNRMQIGGDASTVRISLETTWDRLVLPVQAFLQRGQVNRPVQ